MIDQNDREWFAKLLKDESDIRKQADEQLTGKLSDVGADLGHVKGQVDAMSKKLLGAKGLGLMLAILLASLGAAYPTVSNLVTAIGSALASPPAQASPGK